MKETNGVSTLDIKAIPLLFNPFDESMPKEIVGLNNNKDKIYMCFVSLTKGTSLSVFIEEVAERIDGFFRKLGYQINVDIIGAIRELNINGSSMLFIATLGA